MTHRFFKQDTSVIVSNFDPEGLWRGNGSIYVNRGTTLPALCTAIIYVPSDEKKIGKFDPATEKWTEIDNHCAIPFFDKFGRSYVCGHPEDVYPDWAIHTPLPDLGEDFDYATVDFLYVDGAWETLEVHFGKAYFNAVAGELKVSESHFQIEEGFTFEPTPQEELKVDHAWLLIENVWVQVVDSRGRVAYAKDRSDEYQVKELGEVIPETHTLLVPENFDSWTSEGWCYDIERERPVKDDAERTWTKLELNNVLTHLDQYEREQTYPTDLQTSELTQEQFMELLYVRKALTLRTSLVDFPFDVRPEIPTYIK